MNRHTGIRLSTGDRVYYTIAYLLAALVGIVTLYPLYFVLIASFSDPSAVAAGQVYLFPKRFMTIAYQRIFEYKLVWTSYLNSIYYMVLGTAINVSMTMVAAFALSRRRLVGRQAITWMMLFTMYFGGGLIPAYLNIRSLKLLNTVWAMVLPGAISTYNFIVARTFMSSSIPYELQEAAMIDGASHIKFFLKVVLPLSAPIIGVLTLYYAVGHWNSYMSALLYLRRKEQWPLQMVLRDILVQNQYTAADAAATDPENMLYLEKLREGMKYSLIVVASIPMLVLYPFLQKFFVKGIMLGSIKG